MYSSLKRYFLIISMVFFVGCSSSDVDEIIDDITGDEPSAIVSGETHVWQTQAYKTAYYTNFVHQNGNNLFEESDGTLHLAYVDNYELFYAKSLDSGKTWSSEKIETGHDGALRRASMTVDGNGKVFIAYETHDKFNYADTTSVAYGSNFEYDIYCATNKSGTWEMELLYTHENGTTGREVTGIDVDAENNIHLFVGYYGWWSYGGTAYEYIRTASTDIWETEIQIAQFSDTTVDKFIYGYYSTHIDSDGDITLVASRTGSNVGVSDKLFYVKKESGLWQSVVEIDTHSRANPRTNHFDSAIDGDNHIYLAYVKDDASGNPQVLFSEDFGATTAIYTGSVDEVIHGIKLHSDAVGNLTLVVNNDTQKSVIATKSATGSWGDAVVLDTETTDGMIYNIASVKTNSASGDFTNFKMTYLESRGELPTDGEYNSSNIYIYSSSN